jgi:ribose-phosphate pyrophosphokinase
LTTDGRDNGLERTALLSGSANPALAEAIAGELGIASIGRTVERFPDGEVSVELEDSVRHRHVFLVQPTSPPVNDNLMELVALADACRRAAAKRVTAVVPYFGYARADRRKSRRVSIMGRAAADLLEASGVQHLVTLDLHSPQVEGFFRIPVENLTAIPTLAEAVRPHVNPDSVIVSPDLGAVERASALAERAGCRLAVVAKRRLSGREVEARRLIGNVEGRSCLILDDMISTGGTILTALEAIREAGARDDVRVAASHGVFAEGAREKLVKAGIRELLVTDSLAIPEGDDEGVRRVSVAPLLATALRRLALGESLRDLF